MVWDSAIDEICGSEDPAKVTHVRLNIKSGTVGELPADGVFIAIGHAPATELINGQIQAETLRVCRGGAELHRDFGVFAAGGVADEIYRQAVTAAGLGCMAALEAERYLAAHAHDRAAAE